jgi:hypothetical protein
MSRWHIWWLAGRGEAPSEELVGAVGDLTGREKRRARRFVRRGEVVNDVALARYAVAFARERQRRVARPPSFRGLVAMGAVLVLAEVGLAIDTFARAEDLKGLVLTGGAIFFLGRIWRGWQERRNLEEAERVNQEFLRRAGAPYVPDGAPTPVYVSSLVVACSFAVNVTVFIPVAGFVTRWLNGDQLSPGSAFSAGIPAGIGFAFALLFASSQSRDRRSADRSLG